jgi:hypothetical protein
VCPSCGMSPLCNIDFFLLLVESPARSYFTVEALIPDLSPILKSLDLSGHS